MAASSVKFYHRERYDLLVRITGLPTPECMFCNRRIGFVELHVDHVDEKDGDPEVGGGLQHLYKLKEDFKNNVPLIVLCKACHQSKHGGRLMWDTNEAKDL